MIDQYGRGSKPRINAEGSSLATVFLSNSEYIEVRNLDVANEGSVSQPKLNGVQVSENDFGTAHDIVLKDLYVHDVNGSNDKQTVVAAAFTATVAAVRSKVVSTDC